jgi:hypothetical protein
MILAGVPLGEMSALTRMLVSRTALSTNVPAAVRGGADFLYGFGCITIGAARGLRAVFPPDPVNDHERTASFGDQRLIPIKVDHNGSRLAPLLD